nr:hypothetical protein [Tanacetum cinerariifolium]
MGGGNEPDDGFTFPSFMPSSNRRWLNHLGVCCVMKMINKCTLLDGGRTRSQSRKFDENVHNVH